MNEREEAPAVQGEAVGALKREPGDNDPPIIGWMVHTAEISHAALYNLNQREDAFDAAKRWGASITALAVHPQAPSVAALSAQREGK